MTRAEGQAPPVVVDSLLGTGVAAAIALIIAAAQGPDLGAYAFAVGFGALMLFRRRVPLGVLAVTVLGLFAYYTLDYPPIGLAVPVVAALFAAADAGRVVWAVLAGVVVFGVSLYFRLREGESAGFLLGYEAVTNLALIAAAIALGDAARARRDRAAQQEELAARVAEERMRHERERISRDLHDTLGHTMSVIALHAGVAADATDDPAVANAVARIREASGRTLTDLRWVVRLLRSETDGPQVLSLRAVPALAADSGLAVETDVPDVELPPPVDAAAFRIVQEALTNAARHSGATEVRVRASLDGDDLALTVSDNGRGARSLVQGNGLSGMAERVRLLGGTLRFETAPGFTVHARLPGRLPT